MTQQTINIGSAANDGTGDPLRTSFVKTNANFTELYAYAAPLDALAYNGMQINGSMEVSQELGTTGRSNNGYICDGWIAAGIGVGMGATVDTAVPVPGFPNRIYLGNSAAKPSLAAGDYFTISQFIEGYRFSRLGFGTASAQPVTIGFWTQNTPAGLYSVAIRNGAGDRSYLVTYTQNVANAVEYKTITIPGDTSGSWAVTNTAGASIAFALACGTTFTAPSANTWLSGNFIAAPGQVNGIAATGAIVCLRGVVLLPGIEAPSAAHSPLIMRPFDQELQTSKRYWQAPLWGFNGFTSTAGASIGGTVTHPVTMRATPTVTQNPNAAGNVNAGVTTYDRPSVTSVRCYASATAAGAYEIYGAPYLDARF